MIRASRNRMLAKITKDVNVLSQCFAAHRGSPNLLSEETVRSTLRSHRELFGYLEARDSANAEAKVREQLNFGRESVLAFFDQNRGRETA